MTDRPLSQLTLAWMRGFYREPEALFWVFGFPIVLAFALGIAFKNRGPGELRIGVARGAGDSAAARILEAAPGLTSVRAGQRGRAAGIAHRSRRAGRRAGRRPGVPLRLDADREPSRAARGGRRAAARSGPHRPRRGARRSHHRARVALHRLPHPRPARDEPDGERVVGGGILGGAGADQGPAQAVPRDADAQGRTTCCRTCSRASLFLIIEVAALIGFGWLVFDVGVRGSLVTLGVGDPRGCVLLRRARPPGREPGEDDRGRVRPDESGDAADVDPLGDVLLVRALPRRDAAVRQGAAAHRPERRATGGDDRRGVARCTSRCRWAWSRPGGW